MMKQWVVWVAAVSLGFGIAFAQEGPAPAGPREAPAAPKSEASVTSHQVRVDGQVVRYTATAGTMVLTGEDGKPVARFGYTSYVRDGVADPGRRPITFAFNGGPGSSSIWLHMGVLGPRRVVVRDVDPTPPGPFERVDNAYTVLDVTDLVFLDPVGTGYSRPLGDAKGEDFWGVDQDIRSVSAFIKQYVTENHRWRSPKYVLGESYGAMRAAGVAHHLQSAHSMALNGIVLVSPFLDVAAGADGSGMDLPHVLYLPTLAATAWYHDALENRPADLRAFMAEVERFAYDEYAPALLRGARLEDATRREIAGKLGRYTGVSPDYWLQANLRVRHTQFLQELQRTRGLVTGRIDSRFAGPSLNPLAERMDYDPMFAAVGPAFVASFLDYYHTELKFGREQDYVVMGRLWRHWDWNHAMPGSDDFAMPVANTAIDLTWAMVQNPHLEVLVQQGYYDVATPHLATEYVLDQMVLPPDRRERIRLEYYEAGHMMYLHGPSLEKFRQDLAAFIARSHRP